MFEWWFDLRPLVRATVALMILGAGRVYFWGWGIGVVMLLASFPDDSEKKGYNF